MELKYIYNKIDIKELLVFALTTVLLLSGLIESPIYIKDEAKNAQCAREMYQRNDWLIPTFNERLRSDKPPFPYFAMHISYKIFGVNPFASRFFSAIFGLLTLILIYFTTKKYLNKETALISVALLASSMHFLFEFRMAVPDPYLIFFMTATLINYFLYVQYNQWKWILLCALTAAAGFLSKGPIALILPLCSIIIWSLWDRKINYFFSYKTLLSGILSICLIVPWFLKIHQATNGLYTHDFFITNNINRFNDSMEGHNGSAFYIVLFVLVGMFPATLFIEYPIRNIFNKSIPSLLKLSLTSCLIIIGFFCFSSTKLPNYPIPAYPFLAICVAYGIQQTNGIILKNYLWVILILITTIIPVSVYSISSKLSDPLGLKYWIYPMLLLPLGLLSLWILTIVRTSRWTLYCVFLCFICSNYYFFNFVYPKFLNQNPVSKTSDYWSPQEQLYAYQLYNSGFNYYLDKKVLILQDSNSLYNTLMEDPTRKVISRLKLYENLDTSKFILLTSHQDLFESPTTVIFKMKNNICQK